MQYALCKMHNQKYIILKMKVSVYIGFYLLVRKPDLWVGCVFMGKMTIPTTKKKNALKRLKMRFLAFSNFS